MGKSHPVRTPAYRKATGGQAAMYKAGKDAEVNVRRMARGASKVLGHKVTYQIDPPKSWRDAGAVTLGCKCDGVHRSFPGSTKRCTDSRPRNHWRYRARAQRSRPRARRK